jgi:DNA polymerase
MENELKSKLHLLAAKCLECRACSLGCKEIEPQHFSNVFSNMNCDVKVMVIGQNPGHDEVLKGEPFVGASGRFFNAAVEDEIGLTRSCFYISNVLRCFTPGNRKPLESELMACRPILDEEIKLIQPKLILALGSVAFEQLTGMHGIMKHFGEVVISLRYKVPVIPILHPSPYNTNNPVNREKFYQGLRKVKEFLETC